MLPCASKLSSTCSSWIFAFPPFARWIVDADVQSNWLRPDGTGLESVGRVFQRHDLCFWPPLGQKAEGLPYSITSFSSRSSYNPHDRKTGRQPCRSSWSQTQL